MLSKPLELERQAGDPGREHVRHRLRGAAPGRLRGGVGRLRRGHGRRRREGEGLRLPGPQRVPDPDRRHAAARSPRRRCSRWSCPPTPSATASTATSCAGSLARIASQEPLQRRPQPAGPVPQGDERRRRSAPCPRWPATSACSTAPAWPTAPPRPSSCRAEDAHRYTDTPLYVKALSFVAGNGSGPHRPGLRLHDLPRDRALRRRRLRAGRRHRPPGASSPWPRCTTASRRPSSC